ncbi:aldo/keto reductase [Mesobacillus foraminis]|uniref:aldo/keto reductase n=1 Tax=Mesobacillus foraminis TaxID=279826 RepID=UPI0039A1C37C
MRKIKIDGLNQACSQIVLGSMMFSPANMKRTGDLLDAFVEAGGNTIDTAHVYNNGDSERALGLWLKERGNREDIIILDKGAHPDRNGPRVTPQDIKQDLHESLDRLQVDYIDIYMLHRDDLSVPVSVIIDTLNEHKQAGLIHSLGVSNWTNERIEEANQYAAENGLAGFVVNSPNLSLAKPNEPRWAGCISVDQESLNWHEKYQFPLFSWSSQAGGFFSGRFSPDKKDDPEAVRVYYSEDNWERFRRAQKLAGEKGVTAIEVALAYVLHQPFPTCAIIGPYTVEELHSSLKALDLQLTAGEINWLDLKEDSLVR